QKMACKGTLLTGPRLAAIASQGMKELPVFKRPRVAVIATGSELRSQGEALRAGEIYETNRILLAELVAGSGAEGTVFEIVPDLEEAHLLSFQRARSYEGFF